MDMALVRGLYTYIQLPDTLKRQKIHTRGETSHQKVYSTYSSFDLNKADRVS